MQPRERLAVVAGHGIVGDRYANGRGHWSYEPRYVSEITFIEREVLERVAEALHVPFLPQESRRNVVTARVRLQELIGRRFSIGDAVFAGERPCDPCRYLERLVHKRVKTQLGVDGGLRARIVTGGTIALGDWVTPLIDEIGDM